MRSSRKLVMRRAASLLAQPAQTEMAAWASRTRVLDGACGRLLMRCMYLHHLYLQGKSRMPPAFALTYGLAKPEHVSGMTGREMLQAMIEGKVPAPPIAQ